MARVPWLLSGPYAHRGLWSKKVPENSLLAFELAEQAQLGVELDVRLSADGEAVVFHDATLDRMTKARGPVAAKTAAQLGTLRLKDTAETIPTLPEALAVIGEMPVLVELKTPFGAEGPLEERVARILRRVGGPCAVMSFNPVSLGVLAAIAPEIPRGLLSWRWPAKGGLRTYWALRHGLRRFDPRIAKPDFLSCEVRAISTQGVVAAREQGLPLLAWTVRSQRDRARATLHADQVIFEGPLPPAFR